MLTPGTSAYVAGIFPLTCPDASYLMCCSSICVEKTKDD
jgi:hypothetical protein